MANAIPPITATMLTSLRRYSAQQNARDAAKIKSSVRCSSVIQNLYVSALVSHVCKTGFPARRNICDAIASRMLRQARQRFVKHHGHDYRKSVKKTAVSSNKNTPIGNPLRGAKKSSVACSHASIKTSACRGLPSSLLMKAKS